MNIKTYDEFQSLIKDLTESTTVAVDTETNGLKVYEGHRPISMSFYFPEFDRSYNFAWAHGEGEIFVPAANRDMTKFHNWKWTGKGKKQAYKKYWWERFKEELDFGNVPIEWLGVLRDVWNSFVVPYHRVVFFNAPFDIHMLDTIGFNQPKEVEDVYIAVRLLFEDWEHPAVNGQSSLKWQANYHGIEGALDGETDLRLQAGRLSERMAEFILDNWDDPINQSFHNLKRAARVDEIAAKVAFDAKSEMWCLPSDAVARYAEADTRLTWKLREHLLPILQQWNQTKLYYELCAVQNEVAIRMEKNGILLDIKRAEKLIEELGPVMEQENIWFRKALEDFHKNYNGPTNPHLFEPGEIKSFTLSSPKKLVRALTLLTGREWLKADKESIEHYEDFYGYHEAVERLKRFRKAQRAVATYLKNWVASADENSYIHFSFNVVGPKTGRWSSSSGPLGDTGNGQNIPTRGFRVKEALITPPGWKMFQIDYSQIELRIAAMVADCQTMIRMFNEGADLHAYTRDKAGVREILFPGTLDEQIEKLRSLGKLKEEPENDEQANAAILDYTRFVAKTLNFGLLYSGTWRMVAKLLKLEEDDARQLHAAWNNLYPEFARANEEWTEMALTRRPRPDGSGKSLLYVVQPFSNRTRKFGFYPISYSYYDKETGVKKTLNPRQMAAKDAFNFAVQGGASYIMSMSALRIARALSNDVFRPFAIIHDSLNFYLRDGALVNLPWIRDVMVDWPTNPRLEVGIEYAVDGRWQHLKEVTDLDEFVESDGEKGYEGAE